ncbi:saccharopine dehydrogenase NADP-binding domain-containing protein [Acaryochloris sp. CCMEE 5410]|nr:saccharopine dehydrogenase NADP-binding domain-containing protein [Acaryochloris sp. CCMEE 5410]
MVWRESVPLASQSDLKMETKIIILGGYGNTGLLIARLLLQESNLKLILAGRDLSRAQRSAADLNHEFHTDRVSSQQVDAADPKSLAVAFAGVNLVVVASSTMAYTHNLVRTALDTVIDYLDLQLSSPTKLAVLNASREEIAKKGRCFMTDGGFHPGVPAAMVRYAATQLDALEVANVSAAFQLDWQTLLFSESTTFELVDEMMNFNSTILKNREWVEMKMNKFPKFNFGERFGERYCLPMYLEELKSLPDSIPSLSETGFYISGFNWMTDYIIIPINLAVLRVFKEKAKTLMKTLFVWSLRNFSKPPFGAVIQLEGQGLQAGQNRSIQMRLAHDDAYVLTAIPVVACLLQYLNGSVRHPGLWFQANLVEPKQFFKDINRLGVKVSLQMT